jgi:hypothetical protein
VLVAAIVATATGLVISLDAPVSSRANARIADDPVAGETVAIEAATVAWPRAASW